MRWDRKRSNTVATAKNNPAIPVDLDAALADYKERMAQATAPAWMPEPDTTVMGTVIGLRMGGTPEPVGYGFYPVVTYKLPDGSVVAVHAFHSLLRERLAELKTEIGKVQMITYLGQKSSRTRTKKGEDGKDIPVEYHLYYVENYGEKSANRGVDEDFKF